MRWNRLIGADFCLNEMGNWTRASLSVIHVSVLLRMSRISVMMFWP